MSNNPNYAKGHAEHQHEPQPRKSQHRKDVASGKVEPDSRQTWDGKKKEWVKS